MNNNAYIEEADGSFVIKDTKRAPVTQSGKVCGRGLKSIWTCVLVALQGVITHVLHLQSIPVVLFTATGLFLIHTRHYKKGRARVTDTPILSVRGRPGCSPNCFGEVSVQVL